MDPPPPYSPLPDQGAARVGPYSQQQHQLPSRPPLPPRTSLQPTAAAAASQSPCYPDPRSASQTSLVPVGDPTKRTLLVIYIHGFMGNETSFQSFPAHLHNLLCVTMDPLGYLVHTKVYPKFKTRHNILVATENFSQWSAPPYAPLNTDTNYPKAIPIRKRQHRCRPTRALNGRSPLRRCRPPPRLQRPETTPSPRYNLLRHPFPRHAPRRHLRRPR